MLSDLLDGIVQTLGDAVQGIVLYGSLVAGDFDSLTSDIDLLVAMSGEVDDAALEALRRMHDELVAAHPGWRDRVEVAYLPAVALATFREREGPLVVISPGEPLHRTRTDPGWVLNWHPAREHGVSLVGQSPQQLIAPTTPADFASAARSHMGWMLAKLEASDMPALHAYAVVTACRALHVCSTGVQVSKPVASAWAEEQFPQWSVTIRAAADWRRQAIVQEDAGKRPVPGSLGFLRFVVGMLASYE